MRATSDKLTAIIEDAKPRLLATAEADASRQLTNEKWTVKQILGHLIDSAANNHQRIVRMQAVDTIGTFTYDQKHWASSQHYQTEQWIDIVTLWYFYNKHLAHIIKNVAPSTLQHVCDMGYPKPATLQYVAEDYVRHVDHHLNQIFHEANVSVRSQWIQGQ